MEPRDVAGRLGGIRVSAESHGGQGRLTEYAPYIVDMPANSSSRNRVSAGGFQSSHGIPVRRRWCGHPRIEDAAGNTKMLTSWKD